MEISFPSEHIKIDVSSYTNNKTEQPVSKNMEEENQTNANYDLADFLKNGSKDEKNEQPEEKNIEELLGDTNKFTL